MEKSLLVCNYTAWCYGTGIIRKVNVCSTTPRSVFFRFLIYIDIHSFYRNKKVKNYYFLADFFFEISKSLKISKIKLKKLFPMTPVPYPSVVYSKRKINFKRSPYHAVFTQILFFYTFSVDNSTHFQKQNVVHFMFSISV